MAGGGEETAADQARPEAIVSGEELGRPGKPEIEHLKLMGRVRDLMDVRPAAGNLVQDNKEAEDGAGDVQKHLNDVGPDNRRHAALKSVEEREAYDHEDGDDFTGSK